MPISTAAVSNLHAALQAAGIPYSSVGVAADGTITIAYLPTATAAQQAQGAAIVAQGLPPLTAAQQTAAVPIDPQTLPALCAAVAAIAQQRPVPPWALAVVQPIAAAAAQAQVGPTPSPAPAPAKPS